MHSLMMTSLVIVCIHTLRHGLNIGNGTDAYIHNCVILQNTLIGDGTAIFGVRSCFTRIRDVN